MLGDDVYRMYFADVTYSGSDHLLFVKVEGRDEADLQSVLVRTDPIMATVTIPAHPTREEVR